ncbi:MAG: DUF4372 domain-containing protein [Zoogloeaceae bacterium]|jgi:hypothetical protein|nr:DUF4372 domain-containing protein [Zoogloeaceae bacterium]
MFTISRFHEILKYFPRSSFEKLVKKHGSDKFIPDSSAPMRE